MISLTLFNDAIERRFLAAASALTFGFIGIVYGFSLVRLKGSIGRISKRWYPGNYWEFFFIKNSAVFCRTHHKHSRRIFRGGNTFQSNGDCQK